MKQPTSNHPVCQVVVRPREGQFVTVNSTLPLTYQDRVAVALAMHESAQGEM